MLVNRRTFVTKPGCMEKVVALLVAERERPDVLPYRIYASDIGPFDTVAIELEFETLEEYVKSWAKWGEGPESAAFMEKWYDLTESGGNNEIWTLVE